MTAEIRVDPAGWAKAIEPAPGPQLIVGGPGTGKTEFVARRAARLVEAGHAQELLVLSFSRTGASDLDERIRSRISGQTHAIDVSTYHSFAARLLETYAEFRGWDRAPDILPGPDQKRLVAELLETDPPVFEPDSGHQPAAAVERPVRSHVEQTEPLPLLYQIRAASPRRDVIARVLQ